MPGFRASPQTRLFNFDKVADVRAFQELRARAQPCEWPDSTGGLKMSIFHYGIRTDLAVITNGTVLDHAAGADLHPIAQNNMPFENNVSIYFDIAPVFQHGAQVKTRRIAKHYACEQKCLRLFRLPDAFQAG